MKKGIVIREQIKILEQKISELEDLLTHDNHKQIVVFEHIFLGNPKTYSLPHLSEVDDIVNVQIRNYDYEKAQLMVELEKL